jgi:ribosome-associated toxin RatA of RatAB toxin-antitoxin module
MAESGTATIEVDAPSEDLYDIVADLEAYPEWVPGLAEVIIHETDDDGLPLRATQVVDLGFKKAKYTLAYEHDRPSKISWESEPGGDIKFIGGSYEFEMNDDGGTSVNYELTVDPGFPVPGMMVRKAAKRIMKTALHGLKDRAESGL